MKFKARYQCTSGLEPDYWRTIDGDNQVDAARNAKRLQRKGFRLVYMEQAYY